jgi:hypothetical protein
VSLTRSGRDALDAIKSTDVADVLVAEHLADPVAFREELVRLVIAISPSTSGS